MMEPNQASRASGHCDQHDPRRRLYGAAGSVLVDLAGLLPRGDPSEDWGTVGIQERSGVSYPFREAGPWRAFALRPTVGSQVSIYVAPNLRTPGVERAIERTISQRGP